MDEKPGPAPADMVKLYESLGELMMLAVESQTYLAQLATRAVIEIEADDRDISVMCVVPVGLYDCSSCEVTVQVGERVAKGDELGMFHFGGSSHCLVFRPGVRLDFDLHGTELGPGAATIRVNAPIARVVRDHDPI